MAGIDSSGNPSHEVFASTDGLQWIQHPTPTWDRRFAATLLAFNEYVVLIGGGKDTNQLL